MFSLFSGRHCNGYEAFGACFDNTINVALLVPFAIFALTYFYDRWKKRREATETKLEQERLRQKFFKALAMEIRRNLADMERTTQQTPNIHQYLHFFNKCPDGRPVISIYYDSTIYGSNIGLLLELQESLADSIAALYADLKTLEIQAMTISQPGFTTISQEGRIDILLGLNILQEKIAVRARGVLKELELVTDRAGPQLKSG